MTIRTKKIKKQPVALSEDGLLCPNCGGHCLHHGRVDVFERDAEDSATGLHAAVNGEMVSVSQGMAGNPSSRRGGIAIAFSCEFCPALIKLHIVQHKGSTFMEWELSGVDKERLCAEWGDGGIQKD